jgi:hypothetical protein
MCHADMTIIPVRFSENLGDKMVDYEVSHSCRDYSALKAWSWERAFIAHT